MRDELGKFIMVHGEAATSKTKATSMYKTWTGMRSRCNNPKDYAYNNYGGRGIEICKRWDKFENFLEDMGVRPTKKHSIDRINNNGNYELSNCRWATMKEQCYNRRTNTIITYNNCSKTLTEWAKTRKLDARTLSTRLRRGWDIHRALFQPVKRRK